MVAVTAVSVEPYHDSDLLGSTGLLPYPQELRAGGGSKFPGR